MSDHIENEPSQISPLFKQNNDFPVGKKVQQIHNTEWEASDIAHSTEKKSVSEATSSSSPNLNVYHQTQSIVDPSYGLDAFVGDQLSHDLTQIHTVVEISIGMIASHSNIEAMPLIQLLAKLQNAIEEFDQVLKEKAAVDHKIMRKFFEAIEKDALLALEKLSEFSDLYHMENSQLKELQNALKTGTHLATKFQTFKLLFAPLLDNPEARREVAQLIGSVIADSYQQEKIPSEEPASILNSTIENLEKLGIPPKQLKALSDNFLHLVLGKFITNKVQIHQITLEILNDLKFMRMLMDRITIESDDPNSFKVLAVIIYLMSAVIEVKISEAIESSPKQGFEAILQSLSTSLWLEETLGKEAGYILASYVSHDKNLVSFVENHLLGKPAEKLISMAVSVRGAIESSDTNILNYLNIQS